jgi:hypothetical protein
MNPSDAIHNTKDKKDIIQDYSIFLKYLHDQKEDICIDVMRRNGLLVKHVRKKTDKICMIAVKQNGLALEHVTKQQTLAICLAAIKQNPMAIEFVSDEFINKMEWEIMYGQYPYWVQTIIYPFDSLRKSIWS